MNENIVIDKDIVEMNKKRLKKCLKTKFPYSKPEPTAKPPRKKCATQ